MRADPYHNDFDALLARLRMLEQQLAEAKERARRLEESSGSFRHVEASLKRELAFTKRELERVRSARCRESMGASGFEPGLERECTLHGRLGRALFVSCCVAALLGAPLLRWYAHRASESAVASQPLASALLVAQAPRPAADPLDGWSTYSDCWRADCSGGYTVQRDQGAFYVSGDAWVKNGGIERFFGISPGNLLLSFQWRAASNFTGSTVTNANVALLSPSGEVLYSERLADGGVTDTGWHTFSKDLSSYVARQNQIRVRLYLTDAWAADWQQRNWYDDIHVEPRTPHAISVELVPDSN